jgi:hypothetical protein
LNDGNKIPNNIFLQPILPNIEALDETDSQKQELQEFDETDLRVVGEKKPLSNRSHQARSSREVRSLAIERKPSDPISSVREVKTITPGDLQSGRMQPSSDKTILDALLHQH